MIDKIKITFNSFSGNFSNCRPLKNRNKEGLYIYENYNLRSLKSNNPSVLRVSLNKLTNQVSISGSIRKWYLGKDTLKDLNKNSLEKAFILLARCLNITTQELYTANFTQSEIGQNVKLSLPISQLNSVLVKYGTKDEHKDFGDYETTNYFMTSSRKLSVYDKLEDIAEKNSKKIKAMHTLKKHGHYFARIEFTLFNKSSRKLKLLKPIDKLGDLIIFYDNVWQFWYNEVNKLVIDTKINTNLKGITDSQKKIGLLINRMGYVWVERLLLSKAKSITDNGLKSKRTRIRQNLKNLVKKYADQRVYSKEMFMKEIDFHVLKQKDVIPSFIEN